MPFSSAFLFTMQKSRNEKFCCTVLLYFYVTLEFVISIAVNELTGQCNWKLWASWQKICRVQKFSTSGLWHKIKGTEILKH